MPTQQCSLHAAASLSDEGNIVFSERGGTQAIYGVRGGFCTPIAADFSPVA